MSLYKDLIDKRVFVTGAASGIGLATAQRFISEGSQVVILDVDQKALDLALENNPSMKGGICADVSDADAVEKAFQQLDETIGGIDILIANAGISIRQSFVDISPEQWDKVIAVNLRGIFLCSSQAAKRMMAQKSGVILMTGSTNGTEGHPWYADYNASKAGVIMLAKTMALELAPLVRVNAVCPGYVLTPMQRAEYTDEMFEAVNEKIPMKRHADPAEIGALYAFLASREAAYITGADIRIDGGETAGLI
jgi:meso-butanediol dehydrogenase / (S,S)-butanediol dehydrogenase / diacetyl reductase